MNRFSKLALGVVAALAVSPVFADIDPYNTNGVNTDLFAVVAAYNSAGTLIGTYATDIGQQARTVLSSYVSNASLSKTSANSIADKTIASSTLSTFLSNTAAASYTFSIQGFDAKNQSGITSSTVKAAGNAIGVFTTTQGSSVTGLTAASFVGDFGTATTSLAAGSGGLADFLPAAGSESTAYAASASELSTQGIFFPSGTSDWVGSNVVTNLYGVTGNGSSLTMQSYILGTAKLDLAAKDIILSANPTAGTVPVPGAVWLLGSGLLGLVGVSRRRAA